MWEGGDLRTTRSPGAATDRPVLGCGGTSTFHAPSPRDRQAKVGRTEHCWGSTGEEGGGSQRGGARGCHSHAPPLHKSSVSCADVDTGPRLLYGRLCYSLEPAACRLGGGISFIHGLSPRAFWNAIPPSRSKMPRPPPHHRTPPPNLGTSHPPPTSSFSCVFLTELLL